MVCIEAVGKSVRAAGSESPRKWCYAARRKELVASP
jgi:hypothetical protein